MKTSKYLIIGAVAFTGILFSCGKSFLERDPLGVLKEEDLYNRDGIQNLLIGTYAALNGQQQDVAAIGGGGPWEASPSNWVYGSVAAGDAHKGSDAVDQAPMNQIMRGQFDPTNGFFNTKWKVSFDGVVRANVVLNILDKVKNIPSGEYTNIKAQARFLRSHYYFELKKMFGKVPWVDETMGEFQTGAYKQPNTEDIWPKIEADFKFAYDSLPETQTEIGRANKWAAAAYLAKTYVFQRKYAQAKVLFDLIIAQGKTTGGIKYDLIPKYSDNFDPVTKNNSESVFAIQMTANNGTNQITNSNQGEMLNFPYNSPFGCCGFFQPSQELVNSFRTSAAGLPFLDTYNDGANQIKNDQGVAAGAPFTPDTDPVDPRLDWTVGRRGLPYLDWGNHPGASWIRDQAFAGPYGPKKNVYWQYNQDKYKDANSWAPGSAINVVLIRFADVLLLAAETEAELNNLGQAEIYVNRVRQRAANPAGWVYKYKDDTKPLAGFSTTPAAKYVVAPYPSGEFNRNGKDFALKAVRFERKVELGMEGHRYFDISRWGIAQEVMTRYFAYESKVSSDVRGGSFVKGRNEFYPIPQRQIDLSMKDGKATLSQNTGY